MCRDLPGFGYFAEVISLRQEKKNRFADRFFFNAIMNRLQEKNMNDTRTYRLPDQQAEGHRRNGPGGVRAYAISEEQKQLGAGRRYYLRTYGCQANVRDGETMAGMLEQMGFVRTSDQTEADVLLFNTCAIRQAAEEHVLGEIGQLRRLKEQHPDRIIALCGCMAQEPGVVENLLKKYPQVDLIFGTHNIHRFPALLQQALKGERVVEVENEQSSLVEEMPVHRTFAHKAFVHIMLGCDKFCTYCIVPYTRGRQLSRPLSYIIEEVQALQKDGVQEVTLLGQNVNAYGRDLGLQDGFTQLLEACADTGIPRIRFYSSHPRDYTVSSIEAMRDRPNIMNALHLPVQSGSDAVLKRMNRGYTAGQYRELVQGMKERIPDLALTTDLIVGFPGETDAQFQETLDLVDACSFDMAYTFAYSPRPGTPAARMTDAVPEDVKKERLNLLNQKVADHGLAHNKAWEGKIVEVLCDGPSKKNPAVYAGYSRHNKLVNFRAEKAEPGQLLAVRIDRAHSFSLDGTAVSGEIEYNE